MTEYLSVTYFKLIITNHHSFTSLNKGWKEEHMEEDYGKTMGFFVHLMSNMYTGEWVVGKPTVEFDEEDKMTGMRVPVKVQKELVVMLEFDVYNN